MPAQTLSWKTRPACRLLVFYLFLQSLVHCSYGAAEAESQVFTWGRNDAGQTNVPIDLTDAVAISAGGYHSAALRSDGTVVVWGALFPETTNMPPGLSNVVALDCGYGHTIALRSDGTLVSWGYGSSPPPPGTNFTAVAAGEFFSMASRADGTVVAWGNSAHGKTFVPAGLTNVVAIDAGRQHCLALKKDGTVVAWGSNNNELEDYAGQSVVPPGLRDVAAISAGGFYSLVLQSNGNIVAWGSNLNGQTNLPPDATNAVAIWAGRSHALARCYDGRLVAWGATWYDVTNIPPNLTNTVSLAPGGYHNVVLAAPLPLITRNPPSRSVYSGQTMTLDVAAYGLPPLSYQWQFGENNIVGATNSTLTLPYAQLADGGDYRVLISNNNGTVASTYGTLTVLESSPIFVLHPSNTVAAVGSRLIIAPETIGSGPMSYQWQFQGTSIPDATDRRLLIPTLSLHHSGAYALIASNYLGAVTSSVANLSVVSIAAWGSNQFQQVNVPLDLTNATAISAGADFSIALRDTGEVVAWGKNDLGQTNIPPGLTNIVGISAGGFHVLALREDGTVAAWGSNPFGQTDVPAGLSNIVSVSAGSAFSAALLENGTIVVWGNAQGFRGDYTNIVAIACSTAGVFLRHDGTVTGWGASSAGLSNVVAVASGPSCSLALRGNGGVAVWGFNANSYTNFIAGLSNIIAISPGATHVLAVSADHALTVFGPQSTALAGVTNPPSGLTNVVAVAGGRYHSLALGHDDPTSLTPRVARASFDEGIFRLAVASIRGWHYILEYKEAFEESLWTSLSPRPGNGREITLVDPSPGPSQRFYRVRQHP